MRIWNFLIIYSCWSDGGLIDENDTAVDENLGEKKTVFLKDVLPKNEYKVGDPRNRAGRLHRAADQAVRRSLYQVVEKEEKKAKMKEKLKVLSQRRGIPYTSGKIITKFRMLGNEKNADGLLVDTVYDQIQNIQNTFP